jgi:drug/metabolite transporter (DMT)-like permease
MQVGSPDSTEPIRVVPPDQWCTLPVQPTAGYWWRMTRVLIIGVFVAMGILIIMAFASLTDRSIAQLVPPVLTALVVQGVVGILLCIIAARPYRKERRLGSTTWPSGKELNRRS